MRKIFIIILDPNVDTSVVKNRITELGDHYNIYGDQYLVLADFESAKDVYEKLIRKDDNPVRIVVLCADPETFSYWGYSDKGLWAWLKSHDIQLKGN